MLFKAQTQLSNQRRFHMCFWRVDAKPRKFCCHVPFPRAVGRAQKAACRSTLLLFFLPLFYWNVFKPFRAFYE